MSKKFSIDFRIPESASDLASYVGIDPHLFNEIVTSDDRKQFYTLHQIPKRGRYRVGKFRDVWEVKNFVLAEAHKAIARRFELFARVSDSRFPHEAAYGYVRHRGTRDNAEVHCGAPLLLRADIRNFFPSIAIGRLKARFLELKMHPAAAEALAKFVTIDDRLALGLNASPMLANLICVDLDIKIQKLALAYGCKYTRYADDITMSAKRALPTKKEIQKIIEEEGFQLNEEKFRYTKIGQAHYVTGLSVSDVDGPHVPSRMKRRLRQELYYSKKFGIAEHLDRTDDPTLQVGVNRLNGTVLYVSHIEARIADHLRSKWDEIQKRDGVGASYEPVPGRFAANVSCFVDETELAFGSKKFLALGLAFTETPNALTTSTFATLREHQIEDAFYPGDKVALAKKGLHFTDSHPDLRASYIKVLSGLPYRAFVIFGELESDQKYRETYVSLLAKILPKRLMWYNGANTHFIFEENSKIKLSHLEQVVGDAYHSLELANNRRPITKPQITIGKKLENHCFAVPDYMLAIFSRFAQSNEKPAEKNIRTSQFERLRDKYRLIIDADSGVEFSRRRQFQPWTVAGS
jgi:RNA-directed DNA polymerase